MADVPDSPPRRPLGRARVRHRDGAGPWAQLVDGDVLTIGRRNCDLTIAPLVRPGGLIADPEAPDLAAWLLGAHGRVLVEAPRRLDDPRRLRRALEVRGATGPVTPVAPGAAYAPASERFTVTVFGAIDTWTVEVVQEPSERHDLAPVTAPQVIDLTDVERQVLAAYASPRRAGRAEPATHDEVADTVHLSRSQVRRVLEGLDRRFSDLHLWAPDTPDHRVRVVEAALHNDLLDLR